MFEYKPIVVVFLHCYRLVACKCSMVNCSMPSWLQFARVLKLRGRQWLTYSAFRPVKCLVFLVFVFCFNFPICHFLVLQADQRTILCALRKTNKTKQKNCKRSAQQWPLVKCKSKSSYRVSLIGSNIRTGEQDYTMTGLASDIICCRQHVLHMCTSAESNKTWQPPSCTLKEKNCKAN